MSMTGTYKYNPESKKLIKVSDAIPNVAVDCFVPEGGYHEEHLGSWNEKKQVYEPYFVKSKKDKQRRMRELGLVEKGGKDVKPHGKVQYHDLSARRATVFTGRS